MACSEAPGGQRRAAGAVRHRRHAAEGFERREALLEVAIQVARLGLAALRLVLQQLDFTADAAHVGLQRVDALRELEQALVREHTLDALHARIEIVHADVHRVFLGRDGAAAEHEGAERPSRANAV